MGKKNEEKNIKVKVVDIFRDKYTDQIYELNQELDVDEKRFEEIKVYVKKIESQEEKNSKK